jgi:hypothetical protein
MSTIRYWHLLDILRPRLGAIFEEEVLLVQLTEKYQ